MSDVFDDVRDKLRLKQVVDQSTITLPPGGDVGDLPVIFENLHKPENQESGTNLSKQEAALCALLGAGADAGSVAKDDDLDFFCEQFLQRFYRTKASVDGFRSNQMVKICSGDVAFEHKMRFAKVKKQEKEEFV
jgi:hypothetical protein